MKKRIETQLKILSLVFLSTLLLGFYSSQIPTYGQDFNPEKLDLEDVAERFSQTLSELGINASELTLKPGEKVTVLLEKLGPNGTLSEFAQKFTQSAKNLGIDVDSLKSLTQLRNITDLKLDDTIMFSDPDEFGNNLKQIAERFSQTLSELGINASELTLKPGENVTVLLKKLGPNGTLSEFAQKFTQSAKNLGLDVNSLKSLKQTENLTQSAKELTELP